MTFSVPGPVTTLSPVTRTAAVPAAPSARGPLSGVASRFGEVR